MQFKKMPLELPEDYVDKITPVHAIDEKQYQFIFKNTMLLVDETTFQLPCATSFDGHPIYFGTWNDHHLYALEVSESAEQPAGLIWIELRKLWGHLNDGLCALAGRARQLLTWERQHQYCSQCATPTIPGGPERCKKCPYCQLLFFPKISPAIIVLIQKGDKVLLARSPHFPKGAYSMLAGFVEPGETLEQCIKREVAEEVGIEVSEIQYVGSQSWPFPHSLMIAFTAKWKSGEITIDPNEIEDAKWFQKEEIPEAPSWSHMSIARVIIDAWQLEKGQKES